jgi:hypothetical protein
MPGAVPTNRREPIPIDFGPVSGWFDHDPKPFSCEIAQPSLLLPQQDFAEEANTHTMKAARGQNQAEISSTGRRSNTNRKSQALTKETNSVENLQH